MKEAKLITNENTWVVKCDRPSLEIDENTINGSTWFIGDYKWNPINFIGESLKLNCNECSLILKKEMVILHIFYMMLLLIIMLLILKKQKY